MNKKIEYYTYTKLLKQCINKAQRNKNSKYIINSKNKCKASWDIIKGVTENKNMKQYIETIRVNNEDINHPHQIASHFNDFFIELSHVRDKTTVNRNHEVSISTSTNNNNMFLMPFSENEIINVIASLNNTQAVGFDEICTHVVKECKAELCTIITHLVNSSFESGIFPELLKTSIVKPLFKKMTKKIWETTVP